MDWNKINRAHKQLRPGTIFRANHFHGNVHANDIFMILSQSDESKYHWTAVNLTRNWVETVDSGYADLWTILGNLDE